MKLQLLRRVVLTAARGRWMLPLVVLAITSISRAIDPGRVAWHGSDLQSVFAAVIYGALIPVLVIALASTWLRGDDTPWPWALARPISRARWLRATLFVDIVTIALCVAFARWIIGPLSYGQHGWIGGWSSGVERGSGYVALLVATYAAAAFAGARGATAIGAAFHVMVLGAITMGTHVAASWSAYYQRLCGEYFTRMEMGTWSYDGVGTTSRALAELPSVPTLTIVAVCAAIATRRAGLRLPARPRSRDLLGLATIAVALAITFPWVLTAVVRPWLA